MYLCIKTFVIDWFAAVIKLQKKKQKPKKPRQLLKKYLGNILGKYILLYDYSILLLSFQENSSDFLSVFANIFRYLLLEMVFCYPVKIV